MAVPAEMDVDEGDEEEDGDDEGGPFALPENLSDYPLWIMSLPWCGGIRIEGLGA